MAGMSDDDDEYDMTCGFINLLSSCKKKCCSEDCSESDECCDCCCSDECCDCCSGCGSCCKWTSGIAKAIGSFICECKCNCTKECLINHCCCCCPCETGNAKEKEHLLQSDRSSRQKRVAELKQGIEQQIKVASPLLQVHYDRKVIKELKERREQSDPYVSQEAYKKIMSIMIGKMIEEYVSPLLNCSEGQGRSAVNQKEQYKIYGLLLSAIGKDKRTRTKPKEILQQVEDPDSGLSLDLNNEAVIRNVTSSIELTHSMLILLPPLLLIQPLWQDDELQDTNRKTWDEKQRRRPLIYYRPVMVFGNQLNVATRGLVGNSNIIDLL